jgi:hypothetical protein
MTGIEEGVAVASLAAAAIGTAFSVAGNIQSANATAAQAAYAAQVAKNNATIAGYNQQQAEEAGQAQLQQQGLKNRAIQSSITAAEASSGEDINSGSDVDVVRSQRITGGEESATVEHNAFLNAYGYSVTAAADTGQAGLYSATASNATSLLPLTAGATGLEGASAIGSKWNQFVQSGALGSSGSSGVGAVDTTSTF